jgi:CheY-like chemotaxis protein
MKVGVEIRQIRLARFDLVDSIALPDSTDTEVGTLGPSLAGLSILLVEDDLVSAYAAVRLMEKRGIQVVHVVNGAQALEVLRSREFDLVLMDVQMPVMDGVAATRAIRNNEAGEAARSLPIIALTAYAMDDDKTIFLDAGMNDYLPKPVRLENLEAGIGRWLCDTKKRVDQ